MRRHITAAWIGALLTALSHSAFAQTSAADKASAQTLFDSGRKLLHEGNYQEACKRLEQSQAIEPGTGNLLYLADCYEHLGRTASAWALFVEAASRAAAVGENERVAVARRRAEVLKPRLSTLTLEVPQPHAAPGLELVRDGQVVASGLWGIAVPVDPGDHNIVARAPGRGAWSGSVHVGANGAAASTTIPLLPESPLGPPPAAAAVPVVAAAEPVVVPAAALAPAADGGSRSSLQPILGATLAGVGGVALIVGAVFGTRAIIKNNDAKEYCPGGGPRCVSYQGVALTEQADSAANVANVLMIGGAAALLGGAIVYLTSPSKPERERKGVALAVGSRSLGLTVTEKF